MYAIRVATYAGQIHVATDPRWSPTATQPTKTKYYSSFSTYQKAIELLWDQGYRKIDNGDWYFSEDDGSVTPTFTNHIAHIVPAIEYLPIEEMPGKMHITV